ncbi:minor capsid protein [Streptococcus sp. DD12]|uniref:CdiA C-terminal domain-containing protein n=1 Tax=Streptococcus sp. DD12 TaxID=1777880 RepID=UPI00079CD06E|nr:minor capsid protein [Streptococcus sp. DD12]KXT76715.1 Phage protein [Streptococcus sp. DD12]
MLATSFLAFWGNVSIDVHSCLDILVSQSFLGFLDGGTSEKNAQRLLKTEIARINADTQLAMLKENKFTHMIFVAEPGACDICGPLDGKAIPVSELEKGINMYPMHPNCRCSLYGHIEMRYKAGGSTLDRETTLNQDVEQAEEVKQTSGNRQKQIPHHAYNSVKDKWLTAADLSKAKVSEQYYWEHDGNKYHIDGRNVIFKPIDREIEVAEILSKTLGKHVIQVPEVHNLNSLKTPDYLIDEVRWDLKEIEKTGKNKIDNAIVNKKEQAGSFIIDVTKTLMGIDEIYSKIDRIYFNRHRDWLENIILVKDMEIIDIFERK